MKIWHLLSLLILLSLTACATPNSASPTPTIVRLDRPALTPTAEIIEPTSEIAAVATLEPTVETAATEATTAPITLTATPEPTPPASPSPTATPAAAQAEIIAPGLNMREGPGVSYATSGTVVQGDILDIRGISANGSWLQIVIAGKSGWISGQPAYVRIVGSVEAVPIVETPTPVNTPLSGLPSPVSPGQIIFATHSGGDLYAINADGTALRKLTEGVIDPVVSPDSQWVAYTRWDGANMGTVYMLNLNTGNEQVIASDISRPKSPTWSPDGQSLIISFQHGGVVNPQPECRSFDSDDGRQLPDIGEIVSVHQDSDGFTICFIRQEDLQWGLRQINLSTGEYNNLPTDLYSFNPIWNPSNPSQILYDGERGLMQLDLSTGNLQSFTNNVADTAPVFSSDGQILALTYRQNDHWEVYTYDMASGSRQRLTKPPLLADPQYSSAAPAWSPDGSQIVFITNRTGQWEIWVMNADGSNPHALFSTDVQAQLGLSYNGVNERLLNWISATAPASAGTNAAVPVTTANSTASPISLAGIWDFNFGSMTLTQQEARVEGNYQWYGWGDTGTIQGVMVDESDQFQGLWISDQGATSQKILRWNIAPDGNSFSGSTQDSTTAQQWCGVRSGQSLPDDCGFSGVWQLRFGNPPGATGQATLVQTGQTVTGTYEDNQGNSGRIEATVTTQSTTEAWLSGSWIDDNSSEQDSFNWRFDLTTGRTFQGRRDPGSSEWCGWRSGASEPDSCGWEG